MPLRPASRVCARCCSLMRLFWFRQTAAAAATMVEISRWQHWSRGKKVLLAPPLIAAFWRWPSPPPTCSRGHESVVWTPLSTCPKNSCASWYRVVDCLRPRRKSYFCRREWWKAAHLKKKNSIWAGQQRVFAFCRKQQQQQRGWRAPAKPLDIVYEVGGAFFIHWHYWSQEYVCVL